MSGTVSFAEIDLPIELLPERTLLSVLSMGGKGDASSSASSSSVAVVPTSGGGGGGGGHGNCGSLLNLSLLNIGLLGTQDAHAGNSC